MLLLPSHESMTSTGGQRYAIAKLCHAFTTILDKTIRRSLVATAKLAIATTELETRQKSFGREAQLSCRRLSADRFFLCFFLVKLSFDTTRTAQPDNEITL